MGWVGVGAVWGGVSFALLARSAQEFGFSSGSSSKPLKAAGTSSQKLSHPSAYLPLNLCFPISSVKKQNLELLWLL